MKHKDKNIDGFIKKNMEVHAVSVDFSKKVMEQIYDLEFKKDKAMSSLMQKHIIDAPSINFTSQVMASIDQKSKAIAYQPVIGKKVWVLITSVIAFIFIFSFLKLDFTATEHIYLENLQSKVNNLFTTAYPSLDISPLFGLAIFALSSLLFLDYFIRNRRLAH